MPDKQPTHKSILIRAETYDNIQGIVKELIEQKGVPVSIPVAMDLIVEHWKQTKETVR